MNQPQLNPPAAPMHQYASDDLEPNHGDAILVDLYCGGCSECRMGGRPDAYQTIALGTLDSRSPRYRSK